MATDDIIVVGRLRPQNPGTFINYGGGQYGFQTSEPNFSPTGRPSDAQEDDIVVVAHADDPANATAVSAAAANVARTVAILTPIINGVQDSAEYQLPNGKKITGAEIKSLWSKIQFYVTDRSFGTNRKGEVQYVNGVLLDTLDFRSFQGPGSYADSNYQNNQGMNFIILHELFHMTSAASEYYADMWTNFTETVQSPNDTKWFNNVGGWFGRNEKFVNTEVRAFESAVGLSPLPSPTWGYMVN